MSPSENSQLETPQLAISGDDSSSIECGTWKGWVLLDQGLADPIDRHATPLLSSIGTHLQLRPCS